MEYLNDPNVTLAEKTGYRTYWEMVAAEAEEYEEDEWRDDDEDYEFRDY